MPTNKQVMLKSIKALLVSDLHIRVVPKDFEHPRDENGDFIPYYEPSHLEFVNQPDYSQYLAYDINGKMYDNKYMVYTGAAKAVPLLVDGKVIETANLDMLSIAMCEWNVIETLTTVQDYAEWIQGILVSGWLARASLGN